MSGGDSPCARFWGFYSERDGPQELVCARAALANPFYPASRETSYITGEEPLQVQMLGSVENFDAHDPVIFSEVQHDVVGETIVDDLLLPVIQTKVKQIRSGIIKDLHVLTPIFGTGLHLCVSCGYPCVAPT